MRPSEHVSRPEAGGSAPRFREFQERAHSPSPSFSGSYGAEGEDDFESEYDGQGRESDRGSATGHGSRDQPSASSSSAIASQQKPKRTRQLTTPHQSAVLHALLAQSRFPTTAMREEVGRQIGLSPRKVQVWFQNQRQKARKESREAKAAAEAAAAAATTGAVGRDSRPPQFGPFTNLPPGPSGLSASGTAMVERPPTTMSRGAVGESSTVHGRVPGPSTVGLAPEFGFRSQTSIPSRRASEPSFEIHPSSSAVILRRPDLTGPGVPGPSTTADRFQQPSAHSPSSSARYPRPLSPEQPLRLPSVHSITPPTPASGRREAQASSASAIYQSGLLEQEVSPYSIRLPPIQLSPPEHEAGSHTSYSMRASSTALPPPRATAAAPGYSQRQGEPSLSPVAPSPIPPPFTLEPNPMWSPPTSALTRARTLSSPISYSESSRGATSGETLTEHRTLPPPTRTTRFDPVRNTEIAPSQPPHRSRSRSPGE